MHRDQVDLNLGSKNSKSNTLSIMLATMPIKASGETLKQFIVVGRKLPSEKDANPTLYKMQIFASNHVKTHGEIISCEEVFEKKPGSVKNFGVWLRYDSRTGHHNMYREYRDNTVAGAVTQPTVTWQIKASECKRAGVKQFHDSKIKFPLPHRVTKRKNVKLFTTRRPVTHFA
uniref:Large ribosomal subunit protein eL20 n=1 Tax=Ditylenchus dipsaci TaxID=166011 RepID=A0A915CX15_9BILA